MHESYMFPDKSKLFNRLHRMESRTLFPYSSNFKKLMIKHHHQLATLPKTVCKCVLKHPWLGFPGGLVVKHPPANARDTGSIPDLARSTCCRALSLSATTTEPRHSTAHALQQEASTVRRLHTTTREQPPPLAAAREKPTQQRRPSTAKKF